ncbi:hypothetical protein ACFE04_022281 [Oxalis oulophora]
MRMRMRMRIQNLGIIPLLSFFLSFTSSIVAAPIGICYGRVANNLPPPSNIVGILKTNKISNVRVFNADPTTLLALTGTGITLIIGVPNEALPSLASNSPDFSQHWLQTNIFNFVPPSQIKYIAVGNEVLYKDPYYTPHVVPAINNLYHALQFLGLSAAIKLSSPLAASILSTSYPPSSGTFRSSLRQDLVPLLEFLYTTKSPFMVNIYPYISHLSNLKYALLDYALFRTKSGITDGGFTYNNMFEASIDAFVYAMEREGYTGIPVVVTETGWPTNGGEGANLQNALQYNENVVGMVRNGAGTPKRPSEGLEVYLFDMFDENEKNGDDYEKHFGIFGLDGKKLYNLNFN